MRKNITYILLHLIVTLILILALSGCGQASTSLTLINQGQVEPNNVTTVQTAYPTTTVTSITSKAEQLSSATTVMDEAGYYITPEDVAAYLHVYHQLPLNFITKQKAMALGWISEKGNLWDVTDEYSIGGDIFGNREGLLPKQSGRIWYECDVNYQGGFRGAERIVYSNDGLIYYTKDHYQTFSRLY